MTHDSRRTRFPLLARPVSDASVRAVIPLARNISAIDNKVNLFLLGAQTARERLGDRKSVVSGKSVSVRVDLGGRRIIKKHKQIERKHLITTIHRNSAKL